MTEPAEGALPWLQHINCNTCQNVSREGGSEYMWLCQKFPQDRRNPISGGVMPPYQRCRDVLRLTMPNDQAQCVFYEALPDVGEPKISESRGETSVTFPNKGSKSGKPE